MIRTISKPIANSLKAQAKQHDSFKRICIWIAQTMHNTEMRMRSSLLGDPTPKKPRKLIEAKAIDTGANFISEAFLFSVAGGLILAESYRSRRSAANRRDVVDDRLEELSDHIKDLKLLVERSSSKWQEMDDWNQRVQHVLSEVVDISIKHGHGPSSLQDELAKLRYADSFEELPSRAQTEGTANATSASLDRLSDETRSDKDQ